MARELKPNNLAAAMAYFIAANVMAYHETEMPLRRRCREADGVAAAGMARIPAFAQMSDREKQKMHDWLVCMGGFR